MPKKCRPFSPNSVRHLFEKDASCPGTVQAAILDLQDQLRGPRTYKQGEVWNTISKHLTHWCYHTSNWCNTATQWWKWFMDQNPENMLIILNLPSCAPKRCIFEPVWPKLATFKKSLFMLESGIQDQSGKLSSLVTSIYCSRHWWAGWGRARSMSKVWNT